MHDVESSLCWDERGTGTHSLVEDAWGLILKRVNVHLSVHVYVSVHLYVSVHVCGCACVSV